MSSTLRMTGLVSGLDTDSIVKGLVSAASYKKTNLTNKQTELGWKQDAWKTLNAKIYSFYTDQLGSLKYESTFNSKKASIVDSAVASVEASNSAVTGTQALAVHQLATTGYITGGKLSTVSAATETLSGAGIMSSSSATAEYTVYKNASDTTGTKITLNGSMTMTQVASAFANAGINCSYDATNKRFFMSSSDSGTSGQFKLIDSAGNDAAQGTSTDSVLQGMGLAAGGSNSSGSITGLSLIKGQDAEIELNGAIFNSSTNVFSINGLTITAQKASAYTLTDSSQADTASNRTYTTTNVSAATDVDGIYSTIKKFFTAYNSLINEMDKLYNADDASDYTPLTDDEKSAMSDDEVEKWETTIKDSLLRKDDSLGTAIETMKNAFAQSVKLSDGTTASLSTYGINTLSYFVAADNEKGAYHIDGDSEDSDTKGNTDYLKTAITNNLDGVKEFFSTLTSGLYSTMTKQMSSSDFRSVYKMYDDKALQDEYDQLDDDIDDEEDHLNDLEDNWYDKFSKMETALSKINSKQSAISSLLSS